MLAVPFKTMLHGLSAATLLLGAATAAAESVSSADVERLQQRVDQLEQRLNALEGRLDDGVPVNRALQIEPKPDGWRNPENWAYLNKGIYKDEVIRLLGEPDNRRTVKKFEFWDYGDGKTVLYLDRLKSWDVPTSVD